MPRYRWRLGRRHGRWLATRPEAMAAAVRADAAIIDKERGIVFMHALTMIEERPD